MPISKDDAQALCSKTEWNTVEASHPPKLSKLSGSAAKKQANRVKRFLAKEESGDKDKKRIAVFQEALDRLTELVPAKDADPKKAAKREKEKAARERAKQTREKRVDVRERLNKKAEEEKTETEAALEQAKSDKAAAKKNSGSKGFGKTSHGKIGSRKV